MDEAQVLGVLSALVTDDEELQVRLEELEFRLTAIEQRLTALEGRSNDRPE